MVRDGRVLDVARLLFDGSGSPDEVSPERGPTELGPPIPDPQKVLCIGLDYEGHAQETGLQRSTSR